ncbi:MarR family winged helix-turn-helix transcriptional regulator [Plantactinospora sp. GCM10030261]|uniref:MarR family winged helix-turn-helix transcriptional regulator n=1 Tax=Plantactinospora sp. GCM10030261 TaxID=3273420 RepID=UPI0036226614
MTSEADLVARWHALVSCYNGVANRLDRALQDGHGLTRTEFETLDRLVLCDGDKRRMQSLAGDMYLSQSALSRAVDRLERHGLVCRVACDVDRRGVFVAPTEDGVRRHAEARRTYLSILAEHLPPDGTR